LNDASINSDESTVSEELYEALFTIITIIQLMVKSGRSNGDNFANSTAVSW